MHSNDTELLGSKAVSTMVGQLVGQLVTWLA